MTCELQGRYRDIIESRLRDEGMIVDEYRHPTQLKQRNGVESTVSFASDPAGANDMRGITDVSDCPHDNRLPHRLGIMDRESLE